MKNRPLLLAAAALLATPLLAQEPPAATPTPSPAPAPAPLPEPPSSPTPDAAPAPAPTPAPAPAPAPAAAPASSPSGLSKIFNPDISVVGNALGFLGRNGVAPEDSLSLAEAELGLQAIVDPYARADFFVSFGSDEIDVEEGYLTFLNLPGELLVKAGKLKGVFGKENTLHRHNRLFADTPLPILNLLGSDEGIQDGGLSVSRIIPAPGDVFLEGTAQLFRGTSEGVFEAFERSDVQPLFHLKAYRDLSDDHNLEIGGSWTRGNGVEGPGLKTALTGIDVTYRWKPLGRAIYRSLLLRAELIRSRRDTADGGSVTADGWYALGQWQLARRWFAGARWDESDHADDPGLRDRGGSLALTFWPSEFSQVRAQARRIRYELPEGPEFATELILQLQFSIGAHGAHPF